MATEKRYWQITTALPILVPIACWPLHHVVSGAQPESTIFALLSFLVLTILSILSISLVVGGIPYIVVAGLLLFALRHREAQAYRRLSYIAPPIFAALLFAVTSSDAYLRPEPGDDFRDAAAVGALFGAYAILVGYLYVGLAHAGYWLLSRLGYVISAGRRPTSRCS